MSYLIDGKRITQLKRSGLLKLCERLHGEREVAVERSELSESQRDQALHECDVLRGERDHYKKESVDNWLKLTTLEDKLSQERARVSSYDRRVGELERQSESMFTGSNIAWAFFWGVAIAVMLCIAGALLIGCTAPTSPTPVCHEYGFSPTTGRDSSWVVPCGNN